MDASPSALLAAACFDSLPCAAMLLQADARGVVVPNAEALRQGSLLFVSDTQERPHNPRLHEEAASIVQAALQHPRRPVRWWRLINGAPKSYQVQAVQQAHGVLVLWHEDSAAAPTVDDANEAEKHLLREVHHRLRNNLQGVAGLLSLARQRAKSSDAAMEHAVMQLQVLASVQHFMAEHGKRLPALDFLHAVLKAMPLRAPLVVKMDPTVSSAADSFSSAEEQLEPQWERDLLWAHLPARDSSEKPMGVSWWLGQDDASSLALCVAELVLELDSAHHAGPLKCSLNADQGGITLEIWAEDENPPPFKDADPVSPPGPLDLLHALLPRRGAMLFRHSNGPGVCARLQIGPPCAWRADQAVPQSGW